MQLNRSTDAQRTLLAGPSSLPPFQPRLVGVPLAVPEGVGELLQRAPDELRLLPQIRRQEAVCVGNGGEGGLEGVLEGLGRTGRGCVGVLNTGELEKTLDGGRGDKGGTTGCGDKLKGKGNQRLALWHAWLY